MSGTTSYTVTNEAQLNSAITAIDAASLTALTGTTYTITLDASFSLSSTLAPVTMASDTNLVIAGNTGVIGDPSAVLDGGGKRQGLVVDSGNVTLDNITFVNTVAIGGKGGSGPKPGGGGAGLGGGLFVGSGATVTLNNVGFAGDGAKGGHGGKKASSGAGAGGSGVPGGFGNGGAGGVNGGFGGGGGGGATGGFGAGSNGGGGLAAGGDIFVQQGGQLIYGSGTAGAGKLTAGLPGGKAYGSGIFIQGNNTVTLGNVTVTGVITDQTGSGGTGANAGAGRVLAEGAVTLKATNTYTGGTEIAGSLTLAAPGAAGTGEITFLSGTLAVGAGDTPNNLIGGFGVGESIDLQGIGLATGTSLSPGNVLSVTGGTAGTVTLKLDPGDELRQRQLRAAVGRRHRHDDHRHAEPFHRRQRSRPERGAGGDRQGRPVRRAEHRLHDHLYCRFHAWDRPQRDQPGTDDTLTIDGAGNTMNGGGTYSGFLVYGGTVGIQNLTIQDTAAIGGTGGSGAIPGGGGAGLGGGLFVATGADVTLSNVSFAGDSAIGGNAGAAGGSSYGGGGGLGGAGGAGDSRAGGGGGVGRSAVGGTFGTPGNGGPGILLGAGGGSAGTGNFSTVGFSPGAGGADGGGGGMAGQFSGSGRDPRSFPGTAGTGGDAANGNFGGGAGSGRARRIRRRRLGF